MAVENFTMLIDKAREEFRWILKGYSETTQNERDGLKKMIKKYLDKCCSDFEEEALKENLQEEFKLYLESLKRLGLEGE